VKTIILCWTEEVSCSAEVNVPDDFDLDTADELEIEDGVCNLERVLFEAVLDRGGFEVSESSKRIPFNPHAPTLFYWEEDE